jgi:hypothetical protein
MSTMKFKLEPYETKKIATEIEILDYVVHGSTVKANYILYNESGAAIEHGTVTISKEQMLAIESAGGSLESFNALVTAAWGMVAIEKVL